MSTVYFALVSGVELLDLSGPAQVFHEAAMLAPGAYSLRYVAASAHVASEQGLLLAGMTAFPESLDPDALVVVAGSSILRDPAYYKSAEGKALLGFLKRAHAQGAHIASVCVGSFALAEAGLLRGLQCATHWKRLEEMRARYPDVSVCHNRLYVLGERISSSAGIAAGVDLALAFVARSCGARIAAAVAREIVVATRRAAQDVQLNPYFAKRDHTYHDVHLVQDWLLSHAGDRFTLDDLAGVAGMSVRTLTRQFKAATGITLKGYVTAVRLERARGLLREPTLTIDDVADRCGFADGRQLRRLWHASFRTSPSDYRRSAAV